MKPQSREKMRKINCLVDHRGASCTCDLSMYETLITTKPDTKIEDSTPCYECELSRLLQHLEGMEFLSPKTRYDIEVLVIKTVRQQVQELLASQQDSFRRKVEEEVRERLLKEVEEKVIDCKVGRFDENWIECSERIRAEQLKKLEEIRNK